MSAVAGQVSALPFPSVLSNTASRAGPRPSIDRMRALYYNKRLGPLLSSGGRMVVRPLIPRHGTPAIPATW